MATPPRRAKRIRDMDPVTTIDMVGDTDNFVIDRNLGSDDYENYRITGANLASQIASIVPAAPAGASVPSELLISDGFALETFEDYDLGAISILDEGFGWEDNGTVTGGTIVSRTQSGRAQQRLAIASGELVRKMPWAGNWQRLGIAVMFRINHGATFTGNFYLGLCSGQTNTCGAATTDNFIGWGHSTGSNDIVFTAVPGAGRFTSFAFNPSQRGKTRRGTTDTDRGSGSGGSVFHCGADEAALGLWFFEISRPVFLNSSTSVNYAMARMNTTVTGIHYYAGKQTLIDALKCTPSSTIGSWPNISEMCGGPAGASSLNTIASFAFDESTGAFDTFNFFWNTSESLELAAYGIRKVH